MAERDVNIRVTEDASQARKENAELATSIGGVTGATDAAGAAAEKELQIVDAKTKILGVAAEKYTSAQLASLGFKLAEEGVADAAKIETTARAELNNVENIATLSRGRAIRAAIDQTIAELGLKDALAANAGTIVAVIAGAVAYNLVAGQMNERNVEMATVGNLASDAMDALAIAFGGTSRAVAEAEKAAESAEKQFDQMGISLGIAQNAAAGMEQAGTDLKTVSESLGESMQSSGIAVRNNADALDTEKLAAGEAAKALQAAYLAAHAMATIDPGGAKELILALQGQAKEGTLTAESFAVLNQRLQDGQKAADDFAATLKGKTKEETAAASKALGSLSVEVEGAALAVGKLSAAGLSDGQIMEKFGGTIQKAVTDAVSFLETYGKIPPALVPLVTRLQEVAKGHDALSKAIQENDKALEKEQNTYNAVGVAIGKYGEGTAQARAAVVALSPDINKLIDSLQTEKDKYGSLSPVQQTHLDELRRIAAQYGILETEQDKANKKVADAEAALNKANAALEKHKKALEEDIAKEIERANTAIKKEEDRAKSEIASIEATIAEMDRSRVHDDAYYKDVNKLIDDEVTIRRAAFFAKVAILNDSIAAQQAATEKQGVAIAQDVEHVNDLTKAYGDAKAPTKEISDNEVALAVAAGQSATAHSSAKEPIAAVGEAIKLSKDDVKEIGGHHHDASVSVAAHAVAAGQLHEKLVPLAPVIKAVAENSKPLGDDNGPIARGVIHFHGLTVEVGALAGAAPSIVKAIDDIGAAIDRTAGKARGLAGDISALTGGSGGPLGGALSLGGEAGTGGEPTGESFGPSAAGIGGGFGP